MEPDWRHLPLAGKTATRVHEIVTLGCAGFGAFRLCLRQGVQQTVAPTAQN
jgi:hypothetical protein